MGSEYNLTSKHPNAEITLRNIDQYSQFMEEMRGTCASRPGRRLLMSQIRYNPSWT